MLFRAILKMTISPILVLYRVVNDNDTGHTDHEIFLILPQKNTYLHILTFLNMPSGLK